MHHRRRPPGIADPARPVPDGRRTRQTPARAALTCSGVLLCTVLVVSGLAFLGSVVLIAVGMNNYGSNK
ncbi:hypothetical protein [Actinacidiphila paucisporea]|uniref:Uncharacterized protein n=1 Tax=Actinacidiphila paucisporea TaxID=310782 RepID=A0A1M7FZ39_9ACTN|nr:hypothetical protein [Actinacidiphila paucisporea]SHM09088.1 hypothetical protein SAMN05216499_10893 [Actinacidiphila paucisporea]